MTIRIAVSGKGGVGKTTIICGITKFLLTNNQTPILLVDADPNSNLAESLGVDYSTTIADIREKLRNYQIPEGFSKPDYINIKLQEAIVEHKGFDLIVMGKPEGKECYCYINELLRNFLSKLTKNYKFVLIDTEAGLEHLSRRTTDNLDYLFVISLPTKISIDTAKKIIKLSDTLKLNISQKKLILNMVNLEIQNNLFDLHFDFEIHRDEKIESYSQMGLLLLDKIENTNFYYEISKSLNSIFKEEVL